MRTRMKTVGWVGVLVLVLAVLFAGVRPCQAQMLANPARNAQQGHFELSAVFSKVEVDYDTQVHSVTYTVNRQLVGACGALGITEEVDVFAAGAYITDAENPDEIGGDGDTGFMGQFGLRGKIVQKDDLSLRAYGLINYVSESYGEFEYTLTEPPYGRDWGDLECDFIEGILGLVVAYDIKEFRLYGGIEIVPFEDDDFTNAAGKKRDIERSEIIAGRLGIQYAQDNWWVQGGGSVGSETGLMISGGVAF